MGGLAWEGGSCQMHIIYECSWRDGLNGVDRGQQLSNRMEEQTSRTQVRIALRQVQLDVRLIRAVDLRAFSDPSKKVEDGYEPGGRSYGTAHASAGQRNRSSVAKIVQHDRCFQVSGSLAEGGSWVTATIGVPVAVGTQLSYIESQCTADWQALCTILFKVSCAFHTENLRLGHILQFSNHMYIY